MRFNSLFLVLFASLFLSVTAWAVQVKKIQVVGNKKIEASAIRTKLVTKENQSYSRKNVREDVRALFATGYFNDVVVSRKKVGDAYELTYRVQEKPKVSVIEFIGNDEVDDDELTEATEIKAFEILDMTKVRLAQDKIEQLYVEKGHFLAQVRHRTEPDGQDAQKLIFEIVENDQVKVSKVRFLGNRKMSATRLKSVMQTQEDGFFSFMSGSGSYKQEVFDKDVQALYYLVYYDEGYIQAKIDRPQVYVTPDKKNVNITIRVDEGEQYNVGEVAFAGDLLFSDQELFAESVTKKGELFRYREMQADLSRLQAKYGDLGYAYANIIPRTRIREKERLVDITFEIDKGNKVYIGTITMKGNSKTRDKVIRREMRIYEGELYHETRKRESMANIRRLGFFEEVRFNTKTPPGKPNIMDIDVVVKERNTGQIQVGAGYSNFGGFVLNGKVEQSNLGGRGQRLGVSIDYSDVNRIFSANFTEPYFLDTDWSIGGEGYYRERKNDLSDFKEERAGGIVRVGHPLAPYLRGSMGYKMDDTNLKLNASGDPDLFPVETVNGITSSAIFSLVYDRRDDRFAPTDGIYNSYSVEYAGLGGDLDYTKGLANFRYYKTVFWDVVWRNNLTYGIVSSNDSSKDEPFNQLFLLGGANTLRGFDYFSIGKRKYSDKVYQQLLLENPANAEALAERPFGGQQQLYYNLEFQFPLIDEAGIKGVVFYDIGYADNSLKLSDFRSNTGFGFRWFSPIGPLRFEWGIPFNRDKVRGERSVNFEFAIGSPF